MRNLRIHLNIYLKLLETMIKFLYDISHIKWGLKSISKDIDKVYVERVELN